MAGFITFIGIVIGFWLLLRHLRKREVKAFHEADMSAFEDFDTKRKERLIDPISIKAQSFVVAKHAAANSSITTLPAEPDSLPIEPVYVLQKGVFDEVHRSFYEDLVIVAGLKYCVLVEIPLDEFVRVQLGKSGERLLVGKRISYLLCEKKGMTVACGIQLRSAGVESGQEIDFLQSLFRQIKRPLIDFPLINNITQVEIREKLQDALPDSTLARNCPKCGMAMLKRKAIKGRNAGKVFWVCAEFPGCNGIVRVGKFP